ncbi:MAG: CBS domain-containing protein [Burkholderiales bacterium]|nr:CBS domain-containing protein [Burkholderiales bacterium]
MLRTFQVLPSALLRAPVGFCAPEQPLPNRVAIDGPALDVMTDLKRVSAVVIRPSDAIDEALERMKQRGVRALLVINSERLVVGLITATDVLGEKPMRFVEAHGVRHEDILVQDVMTPADALEAIDVRDLPAAKVGHILATLRHSGRQHTLVTDPDGRIRGIFSATQIARQLGVDAQSINPAELARTFSEIEALLAR